MKYTYSFNLWVNEFSKCKSLLPILKLTSRIEMDMLEIEFNEMRTDLEVHGISLREIVRKPYIAEENVL